MARSLVSKVQLGRVLYGVCMVNSDSVPMDVIHSSDSTLNEKKSYFIFLVLCKVRKSF